MWKKFYFGDQGIFKSTKEHLVVVDLTTSTPTLAKRIAEEAAARSWEALDAPVSGGDLGAKTERSLRWWVVQKKH